jgi:hypothetical protein
MVLTYVTPALFILRRLSSHRSCTPFASNAKHNQEDEKQQEGDGSHNRADDGPNVDLLRGSSRSESPVAVRV